MLNYYIAKIRANNCIVDARINDLSLMLRYIEGQTSCSIPINDMLVSGDLQLLTVKMIPLPELDITETNLYFKISIWLYDGEQHEIEPISEVASIEMTKEDLLSAKPRTFCQKTFNAHTAKDSSRWDGCMDLSYIQSIKDVSIQFYKQIGQLLEKKQYDRYAEMIFRREKYLVSSLYLDDSEIEERRQMLINQLNDGFVMMPFTGKEEPHFFAYGKAVTLLLPDLKSALRFVKPGTKKILTINLLLGMDEKSHRMIII